MTLEVMRAAVEDFVGHTAARKSLAHMIRDVGQKAVNGAEAGLWTNNCYAV